MVLLKIKDFDPNYREAFGGYDIKGMDVYSDINNEKIGDVHDLMVDEQGYFRYFVVDLGFWGFGKKVLLPVERTQADSQGKHLYAIGFTKDQIENLPEFNESLKIDNGDRNMAQGVQQPAPPISQMPPVRPVEHSATLGQTSSVSNIPPAVPQSGILQPGVPQPGYPAPPPPIQGYPAQTQPPQPYPAPPPPVYPPVDPTLTQGQVNYPTNDPRVQYGQQNPSILQRFEERLRTKHHDDRHT